MDQVRAGHRNTQSMGLVDQIYPGHPDLPKIISRCNIYPLSQATKHFTKTFFYYIPNMLSFIMPQLAIPLVE